MANDWFSLKISNEFAFIILKRSYIVQYTNNAQSQHKSCKQKNKETNAVKKLEHPDDYKSRTWCSIIQKLVHYFGHFNKVTLIVRNSALLQFCWKMSIQFALEYFRWIFVLLVVYQQSSISSLGEQNRKLQMYFIIAILPSTL